MIALTSLLVLWLGTYLWCALVVTSPIGALVCWNSARKRGRDATRPALAGALYWACWFMPWVYFVYWRDGREIPALLVKTGYGVLFVTWLAGPVVGGFVMAWSSRGDPYLGDFGVRLWLLLVPFANLAAWASSVVWQAIRKKGSPDAEYLDFRGLAPFGFAAVGTAMYLPLVLISSIAE